ncbi:hypothetical protein TIFTF001_007193 [Ficus carica]|uniref:Reverse transcriptase zinc-binding domain-containing protein n=1 Tax=Ficus carica TaxID=3494 RepID=A0AA88A2E6_FICCA|nr:hypothetical protein TIFTF001_007193 [Ficus carica]
MLVADLMKQGSREWDWDRIDHVCWPIDVELISSIPLGNGGGSDGWAWHFDSKAETTNHALIECPISKAVWCLSRLGPLIVKKSGIPFADVLWQLAFDLSEVDLAFFCWMSWRLWGLGEWSLFYESPMEHGTTEGTDVWLPPRPGKLNFNVDAAVISSASFVGVITTGLSVPRLLKRFLVPTARSQWNALLSEKA